MKPRKPVAHQLGQVAHAKNERTDGHSETNGHLGIKAKQAHVCGAQQASRRSIRRNVGADGDGAHEKRFDAGTQDKTGCKSPKKAPTTGQTTMGRNAYSVPSW